MSEPTLRTFSVGFLRQQGGEAIPPDSHRRRWEVRLVDGPPESNVEAASKIEAVGQAKWREILDDCVARGAISYRHVVTAPIADPSLVLAAGLPPDWQITAVRLFRVDTRRAVAFTHRVVYSAGALASQPEEIFVDTLDIATGTRLDVLSEGLARLATIPVSPPSELGGPDDLHELALSRVNRKTTDRGKGLELTLKIRREEGERRIHEHYCRLRAEVQAREVVALQARLSRILEQLGHAAPTELSRLKDEGSTLAKRLDQARKGRSVAVTSLTRVELDAVEAEKERHEVVITTELVGLCVISYDHVGYELEIVPLSKSRLESPKMRIEMGYIPVAEEVLHSPCNSCGCPAIDPIVTSTHRLVCRSCAFECANCGRTGLSQEQELLCCQSCRRALCMICAVICSRCGLAACEVHASPCATCGEPLCGGCAMTCTICRSPICTGCTREVHRRKYCSNHVGQCDRCKTEIPTDLVQRCHLTTACYCQACALACVACGLVTRRDLLRSVSGGRGLVCPDHLEACGSCGVAILRRENASCAGCRHHFCAADADCCLECGLLTCVACRKGLGGRCAVCAALEEVDQGDERISSIRTSLGGMTAHTWLLAERNGYCVAEWQGRFGSWGRIALSPSREILSRFHCGPLKGMAERVANLLKSDR